MIIGASRRMLFLEHMMFRRLLKKATIFKNRVDEQSNYVEEKIEEFETLLVASGDNEGSQENT